MDAMTMGFLENGSQVKVLTASIHTHPIRMDEEKKMEDQKFLLGQLKDSLFVGGRESQALCHRNEEKTGSGNEESKKRRKHGLNCCDSR